MGKAHLADREGGPPRGNKPWGWRIPAGMTEKQSQGTKIGWVKENEIYLLPDAAHSVAYQLARDQGESLPGSIETIKRELKEQKLIRTDEARRTYTIRRTVESEQQEVLVLHYRSLAESHWDNADNADIDETDTPELASVTAEG